MELKDMVLLALYEEDSKISNRAKSHINSEQMCINSERFTKVIEQLSDNQYIKNHKMQVWTKGIPDFTVLYNWEMTELGKAYIQAKLQKTS